MTLWKRAAGALKDHNSLWLSSLSRRTPYHNPDIEAAVIKATSHDASRVDYRNSQRVFAWVRTSPTYLKPIMWSISVRVDRTRSWVVALKCLMLTHGIFCCRIPAVHRIGRLPFDLSNFTDGHSKPSKTWGHSAFVRAYFDFLDHKSVFLSTDMKEIRAIKGNASSDSIMAELVILQKLQSLLDLLLHVRPRAEGMRGRLVLEALDCVVIEIFDIYSRICNCIARVLSRVHGASKVEASMALTVLQQANKQAEELIRYFEFSEAYGVLNASEFPKVERIPEEDISEVKRIMEGGEEEEEEEEEKAMILVATESESTMAMTASALRKKFLTTVVTDKWENFDDNDCKGNYGLINVNYNVTSLVVPEDCSAALANGPHSHPPHRVQANTHDFPDLITF